MSAQYLSLQQIYLKICGSWRHILNFVRLKKKQQNIYSLIVSVHIGILEEDFLNTQTNHSIKLEAKDVILYNENKNRKKQQTVNLFCVKL